MALGLSEAAEGEGGGPRRETTLDVAAKLAEKIREYLDEIRHYQKLKKTAAEDQVSVYPAPRLITQP